MTPHLKTIFDIQILKIKYGCIAIEGLMIKLKGYINIQPNKHSDL